MTWLKWPGTSGDAINLEKVERYSIGSAGVGKVSFVLPSGSVVLQIASSDSDAEKVMDRVLHTADPADYV